MVNTLAILTKRILQAITLLHDTKATNLANASLERLDFHQNLQSIDLVKEKWFDFISNYDDSYLKKLDAFGHVTKDDLEVMVRDLIKILSKDNSTELYKTLVPLIIASLSPSIASGMNDELASISNELRNSPDALGTPALQQEIKHLIGKRIDLDKAEVQKKLQHSIKFLMRLIKRFLNLFKAVTLAMNRLKLLKKICKV